MAKIGFTKLNAKVNAEVKTIKYNEQDIEVKQYLPVEEKLELVGKVINQSADEQNFINVLKVEVFTVIEITEAYTNINFTDKQKENSKKLYDILVSSGLYEAIRIAIPEEELEGIIKTIDKQIKQIYNYRNSVLGILESVSADYENLNLDANAIKEALGDPNNMELLKNVLTKLG